MVELRKLVCELSSEKTQKPNSSILYKEEIAVRRLFSAREKCVVSCLNLCSFLRMLQDLGTISNEIQQLLGERTRIEREALDSKSDRESLKQDIKRKQDEMAVLAENVSTLESKLQRSHLESEMIASDINGTLNEISNALCSGVVFFQVLRGIASGPRVEKRLVCISKKELVVLDSDARKVWLRLILQEYRISLDYVDDSQQVTLKSITNDNEVLFRVPYEQSLSGKWIWALESVDSPGLVRSGPASPRNNRQSSPFRKR